MKICKTCKIEKSLDNFHKRNSAKDGHCNICKNCRKIETTQYFETHKEVILEKCKYRRENNPIYKEYMKNYLKDYVPKYLIENKEKIVIRTKKYKEENKETIKIKTKIYIIKNHDLLTEKGKIYRENNREKENKRIRKYYNENKKQVLERASLYRKEHPEKMKGYGMKRRKIDPLYKLNCNMRSRINHYLKVVNFSKKNKTFDLIGITPEELKLYLENLFKEGMTWNNYGEWHVDHIIPLASNKIEEEIYKLCHYTNLQPLWAKENISKRDKIL